MAKLIFYPYPAKFNQNQHHPAIFNIFQPQIVVLNTTTTFLIFTFQTHIFSLSKLSLVFSRSLSNFLHTLMVASLHSSLFIDIVPAHKKHHLHHLSICDFFATLSRPICVEPRVINTAFFFARLSAAKASLKNSIAVRGNRRWLDILSAAGQGMVREEEGVLGGVLWFGFLFNSKFTFKEQI
jgi:hypothetical protein